MGQGAFGEDSEMAKTVGGPRRVERELKAPRRLPRQVVITRLSRLTVKLEEEAVRLGGSAMPTARRHAAAREQHEFAEAVREALRLLDDTLEDDR
jgi:hypothetical protein